MKIVLRDNVDTLGKKGDVVEVADGYARNFLIPAGKAFKSSQGAQLQAERMRRSRELKDAKELAVAQEMASRLVSTPHPHRGPGRSGGKAVRIGHRRRHRAGGGRAGQHHAGAQGPRLRRDQRAGQPSGDGQAPPRRGIPHHRRGNRPRLTPGRPKSANPQVIHQFPRAFP